MDKLLERWMYVAYNPREHRLVEAVVTPEAIHAAIQDILAPVPGPANEVPAGAAPRLGPQPAAAPNPRAWRAARHRSIPAAGCAAPDRSVPAPRRAARHRPIPAARCAALDRSVPAPGSSAADSSISGAKSAGADGPYVTTKSGSVPDRSQSAAGPTNQGWFRFGLGLSSSSQTRIDYLG